MEKKIEKGVAFVPQQMVSYAQDAIVSKEFVHNASGSLTLFAFDANQALSEHTAPFDAIVTILDGEAQITIDGIERTVKSGEVIVMPANHPHALRADKQFKMLLTMIKG